MRKSSKCEYTIGVNKKKKRKFLRPEEAMAEAARLNELPQVIKKFVPYKCTVCYFFHVGRTHEDLHHSPLMIPQYEPEEMVEEIKEIAVEAPKLIPIEPANPEFDWTVKKVLNNFEDVIITTSEKQKETDHDDFDWDTNKKLI